MVNGFFRYAKRDRLFGRRRNRREDPTIRSRKGGRAAKAVLRILLVLLNLLITAVAAESTAPGDGAFYGMLALFVLACVCTAFVRPVKETAAFALAVIVFYDLIVISYQTAVRALMPETLDLLGNEYPYALYSGWRSVGLFLGLSALLSLLVFRLKKKRRGRTERWLGPLLLVNAAVFAVSLLL